MKNFEITISCTQLHIIMLNCGIPFFLMLYGERTMGGVACKGKLLVWMCKVLSTSSCPTLFGENFVLPWSSWHWTIMLTILTRDLYTLSLHGITKHETLQDMHTHQKLDQGPSNFPKKYSLWGLIQCAETMTFSGILQLPLHFLTFLDFQSHRYEAWESLMLMPP